MAKVTWLGDEDESVKSTEWMGRTFKKGEAVDLDLGEDPRYGYLVEKAKNNKYFEVELTKEEQEFSVNKGPTVFVPPSQTVSQGPVAKPGEPIRPDNTPPQSSPAPVGRAVPQPNVSGPPGGRTEPPKPQPRVEPEGANPESQEDQAKGAGGQKPDPDKSAGKLLNKV